VIFDQARASGHDLVDDAVRLRLLRGEDEIAVRVLRDPLQGLSGVPGQDVVHERPLAQDLAGVDVDVRGLPAQLAVGLVKEDVAVGEREPLPRCPRRQ
jgi:hypothetical protein